MSGSWNLEDHQYVWQYTIIHAALVLSSSKIRCHWFVSFGMFSFKISQNINLIFAGKSV